MKCYNGVTEPKLIECPSKPIDRYGLLDRCLRMSTGLYNKLYNKLTSYTCTSKNQTEARGLKDNQCTTIRGVEWCVCDTDGCNYPNLSPPQIFPSTVNPTTPQIIPTSANPTSLQITPMVAIALLLTFVFVLSLVLMLVFQKLLCKGKE